MAINNKRVLSDCYDSNTREETLFYATIYSKCHLTQTGNYVEILGSGDNMNNDHATSLHSTNWFFNLKDCTSQYQYFYFIFLEKNIFCNNIKFYPSQPSTFQFCKSR